MAAIHLVLGFAVVLLNAGAGVAGVAGAGAARWFPALAGWAHGSLAIQIATGFLLFSGASGGPGVLHYLLPVAALAAVMGGRAVRGDGRAMAIGATSLAVVAVGVVAAVTGMAHG